MADRLFYKIMKDFKSSPSVNKNKNEDVIIEENESPDDASMPCNENYYEMVAMTFDCKKVGHEPKIRRHGIKLSDGKTKQNITKYRSNSPSSSVLLDLATFEDYLPIWLAVQSVSCSSGSGSEGKYL